MKDMLASLPQYQEMREKVSSLPCSSLPYGRDKMLNDPFPNWPLFTRLRSTRQFSLHLTMAQTCMDMFEEKKLSDIGMVEQVRPILLHLLPSLARTAWN
jgi:hypothetical protein